MLLDPGNKPFIVFITEKMFVAAVAALCDVMGESRCDHLCPFFP